MSFAVTLSGARSHVARVTMPARGLWTSMLMLDAPKQLAVGKAVTVQVGDVSLEGTVIDGATFAERGHCIVVAGRGGWRKRLEKPRSYGSPSGVQLSKVLTDIAADCGEEWTSGFGSGFVERSLGKHFVRPGGITAARVLHQLLGRAWYVGDDGKTVVGDRPPAKASAEVLDFDPVAKTLELASAKPSKARPGQTVSVGTSSLVLERVVAETGKGGVRLTGWAS